MKLAIFQQTKSDTLSVLDPAPNCGLTLEEICRKDVPTGIKYKIIDSSELPDNMDFRNAWRFDFSNNFDGVGE